ncbi:pimeloyl-ACP methyl ester carboxylesterase [Bacillus thuringiensis]|uniref:Pimeloyl-ACP methyl ester carboxylesterase n=1 Tax=Bacillus thuringiensis TaxID=1428 RepID=A0A4R4BJG0_BACTU|nr:alpha/beta hydrolase [Bacillus thuringiensis]TCW57990.1 pimeloyl-ACP methyl ester carboxylesterase [Bacillus thuringiensis]TCW58581.1 pimeloyl-ACP methyl ester carboxylesterase [Bacillus thuringiensis]
MKKWRKRLCKTVTFGFLAILILLGSGVIYEKIRVQQDLKSYTPSGKLYNINGENMHLYAGGQGNVTVVFASGWGTPNPYVDFYPLYEKLAPHVKFAVYDRFGYGYSDTTDKKRDIDIITNEIHEILQASGQKPPYIFVGHSLGSLETIRFAQKYPDEIQGIVLLDSGSPEYYYDDVETPISGGFTNKLLINTGVFRMLFHSDSVIEKSRKNRNGLKFVPDKLKEIDLTASLLKLKNDKIDDELRQSKTNAKIVLDDKQPFPFPLTVLTADYLGATDEVWNKYEKEFTSWSLQAKQLMIKDTDHYIHQFRPDLVADEILTLANR